MNNIEILEVGITEYQERTWGRVYLNYLENGEPKFIFKNWIYFNENTFQSEGTFENEPAYTWFESQHIVTLEETINGNFDNLYLTPSNYKSRYGTPSIIVKKLLKEIDSETFNNVESRRGWYKD